MDASTEKYLDAKFEAIDTSIHNNREIFSLKLDSISEHNEKQDKEFEILNSKVRTNTSWRIKITAAGTAITSFLVFILVKFSTIWSTIKELINAE